MAHASEGKNVKINPVEPVNEEMGFRSHEAVQSSDNDFEIFKRGEDQVDFRTVSWIRASTIFLKRESCNPIYRKPFSNSISTVIFATGILSVPSVMYDLGAFPSAINLLAWAAINTYGAIIQGNFPQHLSRLLPHRRHGACRGRPNLEGDSRAYVHRHVCDYDCVWDYWRGGGV